MIYEFETHDLNILFATIAPAPGAYECECASAG
jgi:hypothetical protein